MYTIYFFILACFCPVLLTPVLPLEVLQTEFRKTRVLFQEREDKLDVDEEKMALLYPDDNIKMKNTTNFTDEEDVANSSYKKSGRSYGRLLFVTLPTAICLLLFVTAICLLTSKGTHFYNYFARSKHELCKHQQNTVNAVRKYYGITVPVAPKPKEDEKSKEKPKKVEEEERPEKDKVADEQKDTEVIKIPIASTEQKGTEITTSKFEKDQDKISPEETKHPKVIKKKISKHELERLKIIDKMERERNKEQDRIIKEQLAEQERQKKAYEEIRIQRQKSYQEMITRMKRDYVTSGKRRDRHSDVDGEEGRIGGLGRPRPRNIDPRDLEPRKK